MKLLQGAAVVVERTHEAHCMIRSVDFGEQLRRYVEVFYVAHGASSYPQINWQETFDRPTANMSLLVLSVHIVISHITITFFIYMEKILFPHKEASQIAPSLRHFRICAIPLAYT